MFESEEAPSYLEDTPVVGDSLPDASSKEPKMSVPGGMPKELIHEKL